MMLPFVSPATMQELIEHTLRHEYRGATGACLMANGAINVRTGTRTGRSRDDRYIVEGRHNDLIDWGAVNKSFARPMFEQVWHEAGLHATALTNRLFLQRLRVGADPEHTIRVTVYTKYAWHTMFAKTLFIRDTCTDANSDWTMLVLPSFHTDPKRHGTNSDCSLFIDFDGQRILIAGLHYAGEMKKAMFTVMNFLMPQRGVLPMHCAANVGAENGDVALFFGLSGTGKTTLGSDPMRAIIGDDEHTWSHHGIANMENGCYPKCIGLTEEREPVIWNAIRSGAIIENVPYDDQRQPLYDDGSYTENTRAAYPLVNVPFRVFQNRASPVGMSAIIFLTCDAFGVLPPVAMLTPQQAVYHFLSGYTAQIGSTVGVDGISAKFSHCYGADFMPLRPQVYADLLISYIQKFKVPVYLVNTGWTGGRVGQPEGRRFSIATSRIIVNAVLQGTVLRMPKWHMEEMNLWVPEMIRGVETRHFRPRDMWNDKGAYDKTLNELVRAFHANRAAKFPTMPRDIIEVGPPLA